MQRYLNLKYKLNFEDVPAESAELEFSPLPAQSNEDKDEDKGKEKENEDKETPKEKEWVWPTWKDNSLTKSVVRQAISTTNFPFMIAEEDYNAKGNISFILVF